MSLFNYFNIFLCFFIFSCSGKKEIKINPKFNYEVKRSDGKWFDNKSDFTLKDKYGIPRFHPYFDHFNSNSIDGYSFTYFVVTENNSQSLMDFDLVSGKRFKKHDLCKAKDVWGRDYSVERPKFSIGIIPRAFDFYGRPRRAIIFGDRSYKNGKVYKRARIIGGVHLQKCERYPCFDENWISELIPVAVNENSKKYKRIRNFDELGEVANLNYLKKFLENSLGTTNSISKSLPAYRVLTDLNAKETMRKVMNKKQYLTDKNVLSIRKGCHKLYNYVWKSFSKVKKIKNVKKSRKILDLNKNNFLTVFKKIYLKHAQEYKTCLKFVSHQDEKVNSERFWFFAYFDVFMRLEELGHIYYCKKKSWVSRKNTVMSGIDSSKAGYFKDCTSYKLQDAFEKGISYMSGLKSGLRPYYEFMEYDFSAGGSHEKIYGWVYFDGKAPNCVNERYKRKNLSRKSGLFPNDIRWKWFL